MALEDEVNKIDGVAAFQSPNGFLPISQKLADASGAYYLSLIERGVPAANATLLTQHFMDGLFQMVDRARIRQDEAAKSADTK